MRNGRGNYDGLRSVLAGLLYPAHLSGIAYLAQMKHLRVLWIILFCGLTFNAVASTSDSLLVELNHALAQRHAYDNQRWQRINLLTAEFAAPDADDAAKFELGLRIYEEYKAFQYDSAFAYCQKLLHLAEHLRSPDKLASAQLKLTFILLSTGLFKEAFDVLSRVNPRRLSPDRNLEYQLMLVRAFSDLGDFSRDKFFRPQYVAQALAHSDTVLQLSHPNSFLRTELQEDVASRTNQLAAGLAAYQKLRHQPNVPLHHLAIEASILAKLYQQAGQEQKAFELLLTSAIADVQSATKETTSLSAVADYCYRRGDVRNAYTFVKAARQEAAFYNARQRKVQLSQISATIEEQKLAVIDEQRRAITRYLGLAVVLAVLAAGFALTSFVQLRRLRTTSRQLATATQQVHARNEELWHRNGDLAQINQELAEANRIKEEYIGYYFYTNTRYVAKLSGLKKGLDDLLLSKQLTGLPKLAGSINLKQERHELFTGFDTVFLRLFPDFLAQFNQLFREEDGIQLGQDQLLTSELRIFALIRLGIRDHEQIGRMLGYSVNTIYTYKTRVKNRSLVPNEEFEVRIQRIQAGG